jgi:raffinose/stachyose/melibiose transport system substrate-binding protein
MEDFRLPIIQSFFGVNMKKTVFFSLLVVVAVVMAMPLFAGGANNGPTNYKRIVLTMGSWRADDVAQMNALLAEYKKVKPNVEIQFRPTNPPDYNATLRLQLESGTGPDLMYARSYATGQDLFRAGFLGDCTNIPGVRENFTASNVAPWQMPDGKIFAVAFAAVSHAVYYNKAIFRREGLTVPQTWEDFLALCSTLASKGITPLANGVADEWDILEVYFMGMLPNFIGGAADRAQYENGTRRLNDANFVAAFQAMADSTRFFPRGYESVTYNDSQALFSNQQAAMFMDGSWTAGVYAGVPFEWGVFAMPAPRGKRTSICFHPDMAITYNARTRNLNDCKDFLTRLASIEGATAAANSLPLGFFPMINVPVHLINTQANEFLRLNNGRETDARFVWPKFMDLYAPMNQAVIRVIKGELTPQQAANSLDTLVSRNRTAN